MDIHVVKPGIDLIHKFQTLICSLQEVLIDEGNFFRLPGDTEIPDRLLH